ncbi:rho guanine nucleotide exchange factor 10-like [Sycon ciliatum]|uniref:rho guanine nucleotide exchange factor 10-like n=1 Tax=Sycon ciliatum TaxID=27933 RepID=UPI0031F64C9C
MDPGDAKEPLRHYRPKNAPKSPYTRVKIDRGAHGISDVRCFPEQQEEDADFEFVSMPDSSPSSSSAAGRGDLKRAERDRAKGPPTAPRRALLQAPVAPQVRKEAPKLGPRTPEKATGAAQPVAVTMQQPMEDSLYEPMDIIGKPLSLFTSTSPCPTPPLGVKKEHSHATVQNLPVGEGFEESFEYEPLDIVRSKAASLGSQGTGTLTAGQLRTLGAAFKSGDSMELNSLYVRSPSSNGKSPLLETGANTLVDDGGDGDVVGTIRNLPDNGGLDESFEYQPFQVSSGMSLSAASKPVKSATREEQGEAQSMQEDYLVPSDLDPMLGNADDVGETASTSGGPYAYTVHDRRYTVDSVDSLPPQKGTVAGPMSQTGTDGYVVTHKEWVRMSRRQPHATQLAAGSRTTQPAAGFTTDEQAQYVDPAQRLPSPLPGGTLPATSAYMDFDGEDKNKSSTVSGPRLPLTQSDSSASFYQPLVNPEHFLPSETYYQRLMDLSKTNRKHRMAMMPPLDPKLSASEQYRHRIVQHLLETEESYIKTLRLLLDTYAPAIADLPSRTGLVRLLEKLRVFFTTIQKILSLHHMFKIGLSGPVSDWSSKQKIGTVFEGGFSKAMVVEVYSEYIEQFSTVSTAVQTGRRTQHLFAEVLRCCDQENGLRLNLESLLLRPVQRFPQFLLIIQDLLRHTEKDHPDRVPLQLALTRIENVTEQLNQRKRLSDQLHLVDRLRNRIMNLPLDMFAEKVRLVSQDEVCQVKVKLGKSLWKKRCLFLFCNQLVCTSVLRPSSPFALRSPDDYSYKFKWRKRLQDVTIIASDLDEETTSAKVVSKQFKTGQAEETYFPKPDGGDLALQLRHERSVLLHDMRMVTKIAALVATLRQERLPITMQAVQEASQSIQKRLTVVEDELRRCEAYRLDIGIPESMTGSSIRHLSFIMSSPSARFSWVKSFNRTKLMLAEADTPSWLHSGSNGSGLTADQIRVCSLESPLLVHTVPVMLTRDSMTMELGVQVTVPNTLEGMTQYAPPYIWVCSNGGATAAQISIIAGVHVDPVIVECFQCVQSRVLCMIFVPGDNSTLKPKRGGTDTNEPESTVWIGTQSKTIQVFKAGMSDARMPLLQLKCVDSVLSLEYFNEYRFAGLADGSVVMFSKNSSGLWDSNNCSRVVLTTQPVTCAAVFGEEVFLAAGHDIHVISTLSNTVVETFNSAENANKKKEVQAVHGMLGIGIGLWLFHRHSAFIKLIHAETKEFMQEFDIQSTVRRHQKELGLSDTAVDHLYVTKLEHSPGQLWIGTSCGVVVLLPVPRLGGVPRVMGSPLISHHGNGGPVRIIVPVTSQMQLSVSDQPVQFPGDKPMSSPPSLSPSPSPCPAPGQKGVASPLATGSAQPLPVSSAKKVNITSPKRPPGPPPLPPDPITKAEKPRNAPPQLDTISADMRPRAESGAYDRAADMGEDASSIYDSVEGTDRVQAEGTLPGSSQPPHHGTMPVTEGREREEIKEMTAEEEEEEDDEYVQEASAEQAKRATNTKKAAAQQVTEPIYELAGMPNFGAVTNKYSYNRLQCGTLTASPGSSPTPNHTQQDQSSYTSLFEHAEPIDPAASIEERRRNSKFKRKGTDQIVIEQQYIVCGGLGAAYHFDAKSSKSAQLQDTGGQLLVWELHD